MAGLTEKMGVLAGSEKPIVNPHLYLVTALL